MTDQARYEPFEASELFASGASARPLNEGTVPRSAIIDNEPLRTGRDADGLIDYIPLEVTVEQVRRGQERFGIYCTPCHGYGGNGDGIMVERGLPAPPSFHTQQLREAPDGYIFDVITNGTGMMFSYASQVPVEDRWAIVAYVRALQLSLYAPVDQLPEVDHEQLTP